ADNARIFIKPHPKEPKKNINAIQKAIKKAKCHIILIIEPDFLLIEPVIKHTTLRFNFTTGTVIEYKM
ncbi:alpha-2,8-polysialyltransferase family protein, partial [Escherichia coli]|uniref:alpha-2,8-polysialyltransferase family protein n=1 Tax=Escherichia coli TaxID=562 RepID=UPI00207BDEE7